MQTITLQEVLEAGRKAYAEGRLTAQHPDKFKRVCHYSIKEFDGREYCCVVGSAMTAETKESLDVVQNDMSFTGIVDQDLVAVISKEEKQAINELQAEHDDWCRAASTRHESDSVVLLYKNRFLQSLGLSDGADAAAIGITGA